MALSGSIALGSGHSDGDGSIASGIAAGDLLLVGAAIMWSIETVLTTVLHSTQSLVIELCMLCSCLQACTGMQAVTLTEAPRDP